MSVIFETRTFDVQFSESDAFICSMESDDAFNVDFGESVSKEYQGPVHLVPSNQTQTLSTANRILTQNITIDPIPDNYGLIGWNGNELTVS